MGAGPVGMTLALDLAWRGINVIVAERRPVNAPPDVKCGQIHVWFDGHRSLYDALGPDYTLLRLDPTASAAGIVDAATERQFPIEVVDVNSSKALEFYRHKLVLIRPDQHVAWRGDDGPSAPLDLIDVVRGARSVPAPKDSRMYP